MMPMTLSMVFASAIGGQIITKTGKYKLIALIGLFVMGSGLASLSMMGTDTTNTVAVINMIIVGLGLGLSFPVFTLTVQNAVQHQYLGVATAATQLFRQIGGTVGVAIMGTVMNNSMSTRMNQELSKLRGNSDLEELPPEAAAQLQTLQSPQSLMDGEKLQQIQASLPNEMQAVFVKTIEIVRESLSYSLTNVFLIGAFVLFSGFLLTFFLKEIPLRMTNKDEPENEIQSGQESRSAKA